MDSLPVFGRHHLDCIPGAAVKERAVRSFAYAFLTAYAEVRINLYATERRMVHVRDPEHAGFNRAIFYAGWRASTTRTAVRCDCKNLRLLLARGLTVAFRHRKMFSEN